MGYGKEERNSFEGLCWGLFGRKKAPKMRRKYQECLKHYEAAQTTTTGDANDDDHPEYKKRFIYSYVTANVTN